MSLCRVDSGTVCVRSVSVRIMTWGWNCEILYCGREFKCE